MFSSNAALIDQLKKDILPLQGFRNLPGNIALDTGLGPINKAFPNNIFPAGAVHEFISARPEDLAASTGFVAGILGTFLRPGGTAIWICSRRTVFPPALKLFGIAPDKIIFAEFQKEKEILWALEESLKCEGLTAVIGEIPELSFIVSRRLQLAVEQSRVTGFLLRHNPRSLSTTACIARWKITVLPSELPAEMPGIGFPRWNAALLKVRNGKPGSWIVEWSAGKFRHHEKIPEMQDELHQKAG